MGAVPVAAKRLGDALRAAGAKRARVTWPSTTWRGRHVEFARDVLGKRTLARHQVEILDAYYRKERSEIAICTGQKLGKTETLIIAILCDFATEPDLNGFIYGPKLEWIDEALWPRLVRDAQRAYYPCSACMSAHRAWCARVDNDPLDETPRPARCPNCSSLLPDEVELDPLRSESGMRAPDGRVVRGYTSRKLGGKGGLSGKVRFYCDESSDISDETRDSIGGNLSGGGKLIAFGNMLYRHGWFYRAFKSDKDRYTLAYQKSSRLSPNCHGRIAWSDGVYTENNTGDRPVRGMANREGIEANLRAWKGTDLIAARIDAIPPNVVEGQLVQPNVVVEAESRWSPHDDSTGVLQFGVDVGRARDPLVIAERRGKKIRDIYAEVLGEEDHARGVEILLDMVISRRRPHERPPRIVFDETGYEGSRFGKELRRQVTVRKLGVEIIGVQFGHPPRNRRLFDKRRDELTYGFSVWLKTGSVPPDGELEAEIEATVGARVEVSYGASGMKWEVLRYVDNDTLRKTLGRSPNKLDACKLAVLDVGGEEAAAPDLEAPIAAPPRVPRAAVRANADERVEHPGIFAQQDELYRTLWGST